MKKFVLFGAGKIAPGYVDSLASEGSVVCFLDNDPKKWGSSLLGIPVFPPTELHRLVWDEIVVTSTATYPIVVQLTEMGVCGSRIRCPLISGENVDSWRRLKGCHANQRMFIVGNGPSLRISDLEVLAENGTLTIGSNRIYLTFGESRYRPTYYVVKDDVVIHNYGEEIRSLNGFTKFFPDLHVSSLGGPDENNILFYLCRQDPLSFVPEFSDERFVIHTGYSVTFAAIQLAVMMLCDPIILIGVDFDFRFSGISDGKAYLEGEDRNHFHPGYFRPGERWNPPFPEQTRRAYELAKMVADRKGIRILNATRGGSLEVFPRVDFDSLW